MICRRRKTRAGRVVPLLVAVAIALTSVVAVIAPGSPAVAADSASLRTTITSVSPTRLEDTSTVTVSGQVTNLGDSAWSDAQAYLVIRPTPLTSRSALAEAVADDPGFAGPRVVDVGLFDEIGDIPSGATRDFTVRVPGDQLPISGADGVYPVGVQILATAADGTRSNESVSRAITLLPHMTGEHAAAPTTVVWSFFMPVGRDASGDLMDVDTLLAAIRTDGRLRQLLDVAMARGEDGRGVIVDPALVLAVDDLAGGGGAPDVSQADQQAAAQFRDDLVAISTGPSAWVLDFDRTDVLALVGDSARRRRLFGAVERATESVIQQFGLSAQRVSWPITDGVTRTLLGTLRTRGDDPVIVNSSDLSRWEDTTGSQIDFATSAGDLPLLVNDDITSGIPAPLTGATLRQQTLAAAALASLARDDDPASQAAAVVMVSPFWTPSPDDAIATSSAPWSAPFAAATDLESIGRDRSFTGSVPRTTTNRTLPDALLDAADDAFRDADLLNSAADAGQTSEEDRSRAVAGVLGIRWRTMRKVGTEVAREVAGQVDQDLGAITVMGPTSVTLSSSEGAFPLTITNGSQEAISVGVRLSSSNPALELADQDVVSIGAGERQTVTVDVDLRQQNATTVTAQLITPDGRAFGSTTQFNVRSSRVGAVLWITMAAAGLFVMVALLRRFGRSRSDRPAMESGLDDD